MSQTVTIRDYFDALVHIIEADYLAPHKLNKSKAWNFFKHISENDPNRDYMIKVATNSVLMKLNKHSFFSGPLSKPSNPDNTPYVHPLPTGELKDGNIAYISLPEALGSERKSGNYVRTGNEILQTLMAQNPIGAIVDLRNNTGGDCWQMIPAIAPLLDQENFVGFMKADGQEFGMIRWDHEHHAFDERCGPTMDEFKSIASVNTSFPVAILYGKRTSSSGEITALAFKGSSLSRSFGHSTGGFSSCNKSIPAPFMEEFGEGTINLTTAMLVDRDGNIYNNTKIRPDVWCYRPMERAIDWIRAFPR